MKFRVKYFDGVGYFPQVKMSWRKPWCVINENIAGFELLDKDDCKFPIKNLDDANEIIRNYKALMKRSNPDIKFIKPS
jgi:hypothetical protein